MRPPLRAPSLAIIAALMLALGAACTPTNSSSPAPSPSVVSPATPTPSATSLDPLTQDLRSAEQAVVAMVAKIDQLAQDLNSDYTSLSEVARDQAFTNELSILVDYRKNNLTLVGNRKVVGPVAVPDTVTKWNVAACVDVSGTDVVDKDRRSVVSPSRPPRVQTTFGVVKDGSHFYVYRREVTSTC